ncbi:primosomal protein N' [Conexibacter sp. JD483]|uniref:replication restart helicase PriA n=1 Tax=unclassified Conexibacter TaxID=2627773 RepID=UPI002727654E|nr:MULTISPECIES: primosomal protein N' [unclassified Conexibacter]MDO8184572.1 primosomal protein N' [Conexibacter sp. CPCC 205706]MDO8197878.1 primosomal protein N' [Conexibacter sp. CPCC 205762]MDR9370076.1 primosomal protein N' [Conexibacter sp. JD483]
MPPIARIEPLTTARALRGPFDYLLPPELSDVEAGAVLVVPFGGRDVVGVVVERTETTDVPAEKLAQPRSASGPGVPAELVSLAHWIAEEYCSTPARALGLVLPPGAGRATRPRVSSRTALVAELTASGRLALALAAEGAPLPGEPAPGASGSGAATTAKPVRLTPKQHTILSTLQTAGPLPAAQTGADHGTLRRLAERGLLLLERREQRRRPVHAAIGQRASATPPRLTAEQERALEPLIAALEAPDGTLNPADRRFLLHGVTGSGKTEVYLQAAAAALQTGRSVIVLVPEIALAPQTVARFEARFGDTVAVLHSQLGQGERYDEWMRLRRGEARIAVGPRSAVFAPLEQVGLVIVDEEHESAYKHEGDPRYDARRVAARRAHDAGAVLLSGSATPRPESVHALRRLRISRRVDGRPLPPVEILDMRDAKHPLHPVTREALGDVRRAGRKAIVLVNRRGWSNFLSCRSCGKVWQCPQCDVALVLHRSQRAVTCHHCGHAERVPSSCPDCGSVTLARHGAGTERIEQELIEAIGDPQFPVFRLDADTTATKGAIAKALGRFDAAPAGVLVGTQIVAKGHDFPDVTLGVVLDADQTLRFPDFRADERTFSLIAQLAGRAGRGQHGEGRVLVQTLAPEERAIVAAAEHDSDGFVAGELQRRELLRYPPFASLIRVVCSAEQLSDAHAAADAVARLIDAPGAQVLGPAPLFRLRGRERSQLVVKATQRRAAVQSVAAAVDAVARTAIGRRVSLSADVDPQ